MLESLRGRATDRKLRLFAVACCRRMWHRIVVERVKVLIAHSEAKADCETREQEWLDAFNAVPAFAFIRYVAWYDAYTAACKVSQGWVKITDDSRQGRKQVHQHVERPAQSNLLRDIFGPLPFRAVTIGPSVLAWNDRLVVRLAQAIYEERRWGDMPILGDALLDAGLDDDEVVAHCRAGGEHVRGCWALDLLLGKE
jgi:hypothetical protein